MRITANANCIAGAAGKLLGVSQVIKARHLGEWLQHVDHVTFLVQHTIATKAAWVDNCSQATPTFEPCLQLWVWPGIGRTPECNVYGCNGGIRFSCSSSHQLISLYQSFQLLLRSLLGPPTLIWVLGIGYSSTVRWQGYHAPRLYGTRQMFRAGGVSCQSWAIPSRYTHRAWSCTMLPGMTLGCMSVRQGTFLVLAHRELQ